MDLQIRCRPEKDNTEHIHIVRQCNKRSSAESTKFKIKHILRQLYPEGVENAFLLA